MANTIVSKPRKGYPKEDVELIMCNIHEKNKEIIRLTCCKLYADYLRHSETPESVICAIFAVQTTASVLTYLYETNPNQYTDILCDAKRKEQQ